MRRVLSVFAILVLCSVAASSANAHYTGYDHKTLRNTWRIAANVPSDWQYGLVNGALTWDNAPSCHNFQRLFSGTPEVWIYRDAIDPYNALAGEGHTAITFNINDQWHLNVNGNPGSTAYDLWSIAAHEFGHILSLIHSTIDNGEDSPTMRGYPARGIPSGVTWPRTLRQNDIDRQWALYPGCA